MEDLDYIEEEPHRYYDEEGVPLDYYGNPQYPGADQYQRGGYYPPGPSGSGNSGHYYPPGPSGTGGSSGYYQRAQ